MAAESIITMKRPGFPKEYISSQGKRTVIEYVGEYSDLRSAGVTTGQAWGDYDGVVDDAELDPIEGTTKAILSVSMIFEWGSANYGSTAATGSTVTHEVEWVDVQRSIFEHPKFRTGGTYALDEDDLIQVRRWQDMEDTAKKAQWKYWTDEERTTEGTLSTNAQVLAKGILLGIEYYVEKAPVLRRRTKYIGAPPPQNGGGNKETPTGFPMITGLSGYEWLRSSDSAIQIEDKVWNRDEEYLGAKKILVDADNIYWNE